MTIEDHLNNYYTLKISLKEICSKEGINQSTFYRYLEDNKLLPRRDYYGFMNLGNDELNARMKDKYAGIVKRCTGKPSYEYKDVYENVEYMPIYEWVELCNENRVLLNRMWDKYISKSKDKQYSISVDRIRNKEGYTKENIQFVTHGFNAWKRNINPLSVKHKGDTAYFMFGEEASKYYGIRRQTMGDLLRGVKRKASENYEVNHSTSKEVLTRNGFNSLEEYYDKGGKL